MPFMASYFLNFQMSDLRCPLRETSAEQALPQAYRAALFRFSKRVRSKIGSRSEIRREGLVVIAAPVS